MNLQIFQLGSTAKNLHTYCFNLVILQPSVNVPNHKLLISVRFKYENLNFYYHDSPLMIKWRLSGTVTKTNTLKNTSSLPHLQAFSIKYIKCTNFNGLDCISIKFPAKRKHFRHCFFYCSEGECYVIIGYTLYSQHILTSI